MMSEFIKSKKGSAEKGGLEYIPGKGIGFGSIQEEKPLEQPKLVPKEIKYTPGRGINFSEIYKEVEAEEQMLMARHASLMGRLQMFLDKTNITSEGRLTKKGMLKLLGALIVPGGLFALGGIYALKWRDENNKI